MVANFDETEKIILSFICVYQHIFGSIHLIYYKNFYETIFDETEKITILYTQNQNFDICLEFFDETENIDKHMQVLLILKNYLSMKQVD